MPGTTKKISGRTLNKGPVRNCPVFRTSTLISDKTVVDQSASCFIFIDRRKEIKASLINLPKNTGRMIS
jgi:hypothetical protein